MLIPLGFLAGSGGGSETDYELIATAFGTGSSGTITFSSIPQDFKHLQIRYTAKNSTNQSAIFLQMNGIGSGYAIHYLRCTGTTASSNFGTSLGYIEMLGAMATSTTASEVAGGIIDVLDYVSTTKNTTTRAIYGNTTSPQNIYLTSGLLNNTAAINALSFIASGGAFSTLTRFSLYGIRG